MDLGEIGDKVSSSAQLASLLEISGYPKPGNVHRTWDFPDTGYEHFLAGSVAMRRPISEAAKRGARAKREELEPSELGIGDIIEKCVEMVEGSHLGGNTHLGTVLIFAPLSAAAGMVLQGGKEVDIQSSRKNFGSVMKSTTSEDSVEVCRAIQSVTGLKSGEKAESWAGETTGSSLSLVDPRTEKKLAEENISLFEWMESSSEWDGIARELTSRMVVSFETGYPTFEGTYRVHGDINMAVVHTFLKILSRYNDTFIARKVGLEETSDVSEAVKRRMDKAEEISSRAGEILEKGGLATKKGREELERFDDTLQRSEGKLNPGTTADLTASSIMVALLRGLKY